MSRLSPAFRPIGRRSFLRTAAVGAAAALGAVRARPDALSRRCNLGLVTYCLALQAKAVPALREPAGFLEECRRRGAAGMQFPLGIRDEAGMRRLRAAAEREGLVIEAIVNLPADEAALGRFEQELATARAAGATIARAVMLPGRRYEQFMTRAAFEQACAAGLKSLQRAEPVAARIGVKLAVENHKDHLVAEKLDVLQRLASEHVGLCLDVANNLALCEDPLEAVKALAPWTLTVHIKDHAVRPCDGGFELADVALGDGILDLPAMVEAIRAARPAARFFLETITRDPLRVPVLTPAYTATFAGDRSRDIARTMDFVRARAAPAGLVRVSDLSPERQRETEDRHVDRSLAYARERLGLRNPEPAKGPAP